MATPPSAGESAVAGPVAAPSAAVAPADPALDRTPRGHHARVDSGPLRITPGAADRAGTRSRAGGRTASRPGPRRLGERPRRARHARRAATRRPGGALSGGEVSGQRRILGPLGLLLRAKLVDALTGTRISTPKAAPDTTTLTELGHLIGTGTISPVLDRTFDLTDSAAAIEYVETHQARAKVVIAGHAEDTAGGVATQPVSRPHGAGSSRADGLAGHERRPGATNPINSSRKRRADDRTNR